MIMGKPKQLKSAFAASHKPHPHVNMIMGKLYNLMVALVQELSGIQACMTTFWERLGRKPHHTIQRDGKTVAAGPSDTRHHADDRHHDDFPVSSLNVYEC